MRDFHCKCGARVFFSNSQCLSCHRNLGFDRSTLTMRGLDPGKRPNTLVDGGSEFRLCQNYYDYNLCNWLVSAKEEHVYCSSCRLNQTIPDLSIEKNVARWVKLESAKRHLMYSLLSLGLEITPQNPRNVTLSFAFMEDARTNPAVLESFIATGHRSGLITINLAEADDAYREKVRAEMGEHYRTILGHFRHEIGHYYYEVLVAASHWRQPFEQLFGDPTIDYGAAMDRYYRLPPSSDWRVQFISSYAQSHPMEDWAETWAHYLHILDTMETAASFAVIDPLPDNATMESIIEKWLTLSVKLNALNRSMGLADAYPFVITPQIGEKLTLVHQVIGSATSSALAGDQMPQ